nr:FRIGIDA-like protein 3 [Ipomoea batatas]
MHKFISDNRKNLTAIRKEIPLALTAAAADPASLVLDSLKGFYNLSSRNSSSMCNADGDRAKAIAEEWKPKLDELDADANHGNSLDAHAAVSLLKSYLNEASKASPSKSGNTSNSQNDIINEKELNALKAVIKCIEDHKLDEQYTIAKQSLVPPSLSPVTREVDMPALATNVNLEATREASSIHSTDLDTIDAKTKEGQTQYSSNPSTTMSLEGDPRMALLMIEKRA